MSGNLDPWVEYIPDVVQDDPEKRSRKGRRLITPESGDAFFVYGEYDDGNGMWIVTGVLPCGQKNPVVTIPCPYQSD